LTVILWGVTTSEAQKAPPGQAKKADRVTQAQRQAAANRAAADGFALPEVGMGAMAMPGMSAVPRYFSHPNYANSPLPGNIVAQWNAIAQEILQPTPMPGMPMMSTISMSAAFVYLSYVHGAVYNALVAIEGGYAPYAESSLEADPNTSRDAAVATASYRVLKNYFPTNTTLDEKYAASLAVIPDGPNKTSGILVGEQAAAYIITLRAGDILSGQADYVVPSPGPGVWQPTAMMPDGVTPMPPMDPWMAVLRPFLRATPHYRPAPPPALNDPQYLTDLAEVRDIGRAVSETRAAQQTEVAQFWATNMVIQTNAAYRQIARSRGLGLLETACLMAIGNMAAVDSLIATFDAKYTYNFWRPVTAIQNDAENPDPTWTPLVLTPNFPEYVAGHGSFISAQAEVYTHFFGTPQIEIDLDSMVTGTRRHYIFANDLRTEIINARTWAGLHFRTSSVLAVALGQQLVADALASYFAPAPDKSAHEVVSGGIRKFVDGLPGLGAANANNLGQYIPVAIPDATTYPGSDYYEIAVVQYREKMHSDLPRTLLRGYVQLSTSVVQGSVPLGNALLDGTKASIVGYTGVTPPHYLGPTIVAQKDRPVRILFRNLLPTGVAGDLFIPVDVTVMGSGMGPSLGEMAETDPQNPMCGMGYDMDGNRIAKNPDCFAENRATLHLHGGISPWISDGTPHQWITPAGENTSYPKGVSVVNVPGMPDPGPGAMTFFYTNQQSARLMFYHDHAWGITRLNVYAGEAAPYIITDATEQSLVSQGLIPGAVDTIPLVIQDKTFVPGEAQLAVSDETWDIARWGGPGNLWLPHVYSPAQNPGDSSGVNQFGRWAYGPWFWPPTSNIMYGPVTNAFYDPNCDPNLQWCEPPMMPGTPYNSMGMEAFQDTPVVNGTAYPTLTVDPKAYRFRVLNAASDRFFNLSLYKAVDSNGVVCDTANITPAPSLTGVACTEAALNPDEVAAALADPTIFPTPLAGTEGPAWIQIGTEGGFLPAPAVLPAQPTTWVNDPTVFNAGNVDLHSLLLGPAERADVIVDFSQYAGQTLILYNDAPAAFPARDPRYDYYTNNGDYRDTGGAPSTLPGYGPNTRTVMQIKVAAGTPAPVFNVTALETAFKAESLGGQGVFKNGQHPIIVGQGVYNSAYGTSFVNSGALDGFARITDFSLTFSTLSGTQMNNFPFQSKAIQDEMGEAFDNEYGRMSGNLGLERPLTEAGVQQNLILYPYVNPASELIDATRLPKAIDPLNPSYKVQPISDANDGTQIWKITHNGVDTHPIHFHLFDVQLLNRVGWDGIIRPPDANELGWKDTVRISPLEDTIVALRPIVPVTPFDNQLPNSIRPLNPMMPIGSTLMFNSTDAFGNPTAPIINTLTNFGFEYVWHCHILSHEEMDMMRPISVAAPPKKPTIISGTITGNGSKKQVNLTWTDASSNESSFTIQRSSTANGPWTNLATVAANTTTYVDVIGNTGQAYFYRVVAVNTVGYTETPGYSNLTVMGTSNTFPVGTIQTNPPASPTNLTAAAQSGPLVLLTWTDNANNETGFIIERAIGAGPFTTLITVAASNGNVSYTDTTVTAGSTYSYRVAALNSAGVSGYSNTASVSLAAPPDRSCFCNCNGPGNEEWQKCNSDADLDERCQ
jgi:FtsP/CotA-like multicopper oxidase with cupredoxin domain